ncbi:MAG: 1-(5-phosphoribosyl)-5-[(5-phosphoribosylamino)methylideneamino]imidazole-4-carboxamide isomerase [Gammaproteobacteria bacterium]|nr:1-(5-phosphoribosyl)-5-[(5-phosphoribosylamino)methylideneamino]imidazole-4-carboxamide isomerase [Gammaproteobacteria bacterium]
MRLIPAIDILDGKVVRLHQGDYADSVQYSNSPLQQLQAYEQAGAKLVHIVDLDAAKQGRFVNAPVIGELLAKANVQLQVAGGIRSQTDFEHRMTLGIQRIVVGSYVVTHSDDFCRWLRQYDADRIVAAVDVQKNPQGEYIPRIKGWTEAARMSLFELLVKLSAHGLRHLLCTDISKDGMLSGPNFDLYAEIQQRHPNLIVQASGGVSSLHDLERLHDMGMHECISGKALLDGRIDMASALARFAT